MMIFLRFLYFISSLTLGLSVACSAFAVEGKIGPSGEPVPRFVSLKADFVNVRRGPGRNHKILWVFKQLGLPLKIVSEYEEWREIEDQAGARGWIYYSLLSRRRTGITLDPQGQGVSYFSLFEEASKSSAQVAKIGKGVIVHILSCEESWCHVSVNNKLSGFIPQLLLWGLFKNEPLK